jgi:hypothetical protein
MNVSPGDVNPIRRHERDAVLDDPRFLLADVVAVTGMSQNVIKAWLTRGEPPAIPLGPFDRPALGKGSARVFTLRRVISIALTAELVRLGLAPSRAGLLAYALTDGTTRGRPPNEQAVLIAFRDSETFVIATKSSLIGNIFKKRPPCPDEEATVPVSFIAVSYEDIRKSVIARLKQRGKEI